MGPPAGGQARRPAIFTSIALFGLVHVRPYSWSRALLFPVVGGVIFACLYIRWDSLLLSMTMHTIVDLIDLFNGP